MIPFVLSSYFNATSAVAAGGLYDRSMAGGYVSLSEPDNLWTLVNSNDCSMTEFSNREFPAAGTDCSAQPAGSVAFSIVQGCLDQSGWVVYCNDASGQWTELQLNGGAMKGAATLHGEEKWLLRVDVDNTAATADSPTSWLLGEASAIGTQIPYRCDNAAPSGMGRGGSLFICVSSMTQRSVMSAMICTQGAATDTPACATDPTSLALNQPSFGPECFVGAEPVPFADLDD